MAADFGIDVHLDRVLQREEGMEPWEVMISESQERAWWRSSRRAPRRRRSGDRPVELHRAVIGEVTETGLLCAFWDEDEVGSIPRGCSRTSACATPSPPRAAPRAAGDTDEHPGSSEALLALLASLGAPSRAFVTRRYDQLVQSRTIRRPGLDAAVLRLRPAWRGLA